MNNNDDCSWDSLISQMPGASMIDRRSIISIHVNYGKKNTGSRRLLARPRGIKKVCRGCP